MKNYLVVLLMFVSPTLTWAATEDDPLITKVMSEFRTFQDQGSSLVEWNIDTWVGKDLSKVWFKSSGQYVGSEIEGGDVELVYSRAISPYWDQQFGVRRDVASAGDNRSWLSYGYIGLAPYFISVDASVYVGEESSTQLRIQLEKELMLTQQWILTPEFDLVANGSSNANYGEGSGLSEIEFGLRLGYERSRKFQPFAGVLLRKAFGGTERFIEANGGDSSSIEGMIGIQAWF